ncbi:MAG: glycosyltransferase [bacterium]|jgi:glycosyltransferase involved in cell wall biosynthesis|nr:glycosyltransferase [bacterium]
MGRHPEQRLEAQPKAPLASGIRLAARPLVDLEIVVPALNEEHRIGTTISTIGDYLARQPYLGAVVIIDNGSVDRTADAVAEAAADCQVSVHLTNCARRGKGAAIRRGILTSHASFVGYCDADLATPIETLDAVWTLLHSGYPIVIGSRRCPGSTGVRERSLTRKVGSWGFHLLVHPLVGTVGDTQCGFKFFEGVVAHWIFERCMTDGFAFDVEVLARAATAGIPVHEIPVEWSEKPGSTLRPVRDGVPSMLAVASVARTLRHDRVPEIQ